MKPQISGSLANRISVKSAVVCHPWKIPLMTICKPLLIMDDCGWKSEFSDNIFFPCGLIYDVDSYLTIQRRWLVNGELETIWKEELWHTRITILTFAWMGWGKPRISSVWIIGALTDMQPKYLPLPLCQPTPSYTSRTNSINVCLYLP